MNSEVNSSLDFAREIRTHALNMVFSAKSSHIGSCLSIADVVAVLYSEILNVRPDDPNWKERDRLVLSKGHACAIIYAALAEKGFIKISELSSFGQSYSRLMTHISHKVPGVEFSTGSLGHGLPFSTGKALAGKLSGANWRSFVILGDGELDEGSNWEAALFAAHHGLDNLVAIVDGNNLQSLTTVDQTLKLEPLRDKFTSFGWDVLEIDGHDHNEIKAACSRDATRTKPLLIVARTIKGKGVSFMENQVLWHYKNPNEDELQRALAQVKSLK